MSDYSAFLRAKIKAAPSTGFMVDDADIPTHLADGRPIKDHQRAIVKWALAGGCRAIFAAFGLGKSIIQIMILWAILKRHGGAALIVAPLGVRQEFIRDARLLGIDIKFIRSAADIDIDGEGNPGGLYITNYETVRDGKLDLSLFIAASLDEASILRSFGTKTFQTFLPLFAVVRYRFVATATPSPNRYKELIHYAGFLGIMDTGQALTRFFQRNPEKANDLTLYPHKEEEFWLWLNSWAIFLQRPSDLGFSDEGYDLPPMAPPTYHMVQANIAAAGEDSLGQHLLLRDAAIGVQDAAREKRDTLGARIAKMMEIISQDPDSHYIIWHDLEDERRAIEAALPGVTTAYGSQDLDEREAVILDFADGRSKYLAVKPVIAGSGCNLQRHCHKAIFLGIGFKFNDFIQSIHRIYRFLQTEPVEIHIIYAETETEVLRTLQGKWRQHEELTEKMSGIIRAHGLSHDAAVTRLERSIGCERREAKGDGWTMVHSDCVEETARMEADSIDLIVTSIPFSNHYEYTPSYNDFGHTDDDGHFFAQMDYLTPQLLRILKPGRVAAVHVKDRINFASVTGLTRPTVNPFHALTIEHFRRHGFAYMGLHFISTDVVYENNQTYRLTYKELRKDSTKMGCGSPEFVLLFFKLPTDHANGYADDPVTKGDDYTLARWQVDAHAFWRSSGDRLVTAEELASLNPGALAKAFTEWSLADVYDHEEHVAIGEALAERGALPKTFMALQPGSLRPDVWTDVVRMQTLNGEQAKKRLEKHVCPLQFDTTDRLIRLYSKPGELVFDPFGGLGTIPVRAMKLGRRGYATELNPDSYRDAVRHCRATEAEVSVPSLFDLISTSSDSEAA